MCRSMLQLSQRSELNCLCLDVKGGATVLTLGYWVIEQYEHIISDLIR